MKIHKQDLVSVLNKFTNNTNPRDPGRLKEKSECAALLLKYFPPARDSVLEYYSQTISAILKVIVKINILNLSLQVMLIFYRIFDPFY